MPSIIIMSSGRTRHQYGRSATTCYTNLLPDTSSTHHADILNRCSNLFSRIASRVRSSSQTAEDRVPLHSSSSSMANPPTSPRIPSSSSYSSQYPLLLKYSKHDEPTSRYDKYSDYKPSSRYEDSLTSSPRYRSRCVGLAPSASFSSFSNLKSDYGDYGSTTTGRRGVDASSDYPKDLSIRTGGDHSRRAGGAGVGGDSTDNEGVGYGLKSVYGSASTSYVPGAGAQDKIGSRYKPSRFLKSSNLLRGRCDEGEEDTLLLSSKNASASSTAASACSKQPDYWSQYSIMSPTYLLNKYSAPDKSTGASKDSNSLRHTKYGGGATSATDRHRPVTLPDRKDTRTRILESSPDDTAAILRRRECAQLINMYSLPLDMLQGIDKSRKFRKRGQEGSDAEPISRFDQVKQMAAQVSCLRADDDTSFGPPRKVYGSATTGDMLSSLSKGRSLQTSSGGTATPSLHSNSTPDSDSYVLHEPPVVFEKAATKEKPPPSRPSYLYLSESYDNSNNFVPLSLTRTPATFVSTPTNISSSSAFTDEHLNPSFTYDKISPMPISKTEPDASNGDPATCCSPVTVSASTAPTYTASVRTKYPDYSSKPSSGYCDDISDQILSNTSFTTYKTAGPTTYVGGVAYVEAIHPKPLTYLSPTQPKPSVAGISYINHADTTENLSATNSSSSSSNSSNSLHPSTGTTTTLTDISPKGDAAPPLPPPPPSVEESSYALTQYKSLAVKGMGLKLPTPTNGSSLRLNNKMFIPEIPPFKGGMYRSGGGSNQLQVIGEMQHIPVVTGSTKSSKFSSLYGSSSVSSYDVSVWRSALFLYYNYSQNKNISASPPKISLKSTFQRCHINC